MHNITHIYPRIEYSIVAHSAHRQSHSFSRPLVRFFASDDNIKGGSSRGGIIGNISTPNIGRTSSNDINAIGIGKSGAYGSSDNNPYKTSDEEKGEITSHMNVAQSVTECGKLCPDHSSKEESKMGSSSKSNQSDTASGSSSDTVKQWQEVTANLPSKEQVEKFTFRIVAFVYDILTLTINWGIRFVNEKILANDTVKLYWKRFHEKMDEAKKD